MILTVLKCTWCVSFLFFFLRVHLHGRRRPPDAYSYTVHRSFNGELWPQRLQKLYCHLLWQRYLQFTPGILFLPECVAVVLLTNWHFGLQPTVYSGKGRIKSGLLQPILCYQAPETNNDNLDNCKLRYDDGKCALRYHTQPILLKKHLLW